MSCLAGCLKHWRPADFQHQGISAVVRKTRTVQLGLNPQEKVNRHSTWELLFWKSPGEEQRDRVTSRMHVEFLRVLFVQAGVPCVTSAVEGTETCPGKKMFYEQYPGFSPAGVRKDEFLLVHTPTCARYLGGLFGMVPELPMTAARCDQIAVLVHDFLLKASQPMYGPERQQLFKEYIQTLVALLGEQRGEDFFAGDKCNYADLQVMVMLQTMEELSKKDYFEVCSSTSKLGDFRAKMEQLPHIKEYLAAKNK